MSKTSKIKALNSFGIEEFHNFIAQRMKGEKDLSIDTVLSNQKNFDETPFKGEIDLDKKFNDRYDLAIYLHETLKEFDNNRFEYGRENLDPNGCSVGLWSWFALVYFDQLYDYDAKTSVSDHVHFIFAPHLGQRWYRHSVFTPFYLFERWGERSRFFISGEISKYGQVIESTISRNYLMTSTVAIELMNFLYSDPENSGIVKQFASSQPNNSILKSKKRSNAGYGSIERFAKVWQRLKLTYHVQNLEQNELLDLFGKEFKQWVE